MEYNLLQVIMDKTLFAQSLIKSLSGIILVGIMIFLPAESFSYWQGWLFIGIQFVPMILVGVILMLKNPALLRKRLDAKEKEHEQVKYKLIPGLW